MNKNGDSDCAGDWVILGRMGRIHGIKGWIKLHSFTEPPENISAYEHFTVPGEQHPQMLEMDDIRPLGNTFIAHFRGYDDPEKTRELTGLELAVTRDELPPLASDEFYWHQLVGLAVINLAGEHLGRVVKLLETGANDVLVVQGDGNSIDQRERLLPFRWQQVIKSVDLAMEVIKVDWPADYLA